MSAPRPIAPRTWNAMQRSRAIARHDAHFAELTEVKGQLQLERTRRARAETALATIINSIEDGTSTSDIARSARMALGLPVIPSST